MGHDVGTFGCYMDSHIGCRDLPRLDGQSSQPSSWIPHDRPEPRDAVQSRAKGLGSPNDGAASGHTGLLPDLDLREDEIGQTSPVELLGPGERR